jgi:hypothetical protein
MAVGREEIGSDRNRNKQNEFLPRNFFMKKYGSKYNRKDGDRADKKCEIDGRTVLNREYFCKSDGDGTDHRHRKQDEPIFVPDDPEMGALPIRNGYPVGKGKKA